jgi:hypothetical protein
MFKVLVPAVAACALVAFAARTQSVESTPDAPSMAWRLSYEDSLAKLTYGVANSDHLAVMITCVPGESTAVVYGEAQPDSPRLVHASMGPAALDPLTGGDAYETVIPLQDASLTNLASNGAIRLIGDTGPTVLQADRAERRLAADFLTYCGSSRV